ncbi:MAG TPA: NAD(P)H-dependent oxidoreductase [Lactovum miscens]|uniref:NADPH-dependent FMN reductase n=1 Tax=Lactovum miscens TaxID=190387 RepID=UPI002ED86A56
MLKIGVVLGSVREGRNGLSVANWTMEKSKEFSNADEVSFELVDLADYNLPFLGVTPTAEQAIAIGSWSEKIASFDGYIFITAEYNHGIAGAFKNALDFLKPEVKNKAVAFIGYGGLGAARAIESMRMVSGELALATTQRNVNFSLITDFENMSTFAPADFHEGELKELLQQLAAWSTALKTIR